LIVVDGLQQGLEEDWTKIDQQAAALSFDAIGASTTVLLLALIPSPSAAIK
jgi:hypothetical protein